MIAPALKIFSGVNFLIANNSLIYSDKLWFSSCPILTLTVLSSVRSCIFVLNKFRTDGLPFDILQTKCVEYLVILNDFFLQLGIY